MSTLTGWDYSQDERDEAVEVAACKSCRARRGEPCLRFRRDAESDHPEYDRYVHVARMRAVFG